MNKAHKIYKLLYKAFGPQNWWPSSVRLRRTSSFALRAPADKSEGKPAAPFEVIVGAILTQSTNWKNVEKAIASLIKARQLSLNKLSKIDNRELEGLIRPAGYFRQKAKKLKAFVRHVISNHGTLKKMFSQPLKELRQELLSIHGIGPETADSIILYAANKPSFVVDAYTKRIGHRLGLFSFSKYDEIKAYFEQNLPGSVETFNEYHALLVELGKRFCRKKPLCGECPLALICRNSGKTGRGHGNSL